MLIKESGLSRLVAQRTTRGISLEDFNARPLYKTRKVYGRQQRKSTIFRFGWAARLAPEACVEGSRVQRPSGRAAPGFRTLTLAGDEASTGSGSDSLSWHSALALARFINALPVRKRRRGNANVSAEQPGMLVFNYLITLADIVQQFRPIKNLNVAAHITDHALLL